MSIIWTVRNKLGRLYRTAIKLSPLTRIHIFWRGDLDRAMHDHPNDFWTFPPVGYWESVYDPRENHYFTQYVKPWRWHYRPAEYVHRVRGRYRWTDMDMGTYYGGGFITLVRERKPHRRWGFWVWEPDQMAMRWVYWRKYLGQED